ncbi:MAG: hypothetical protein E7272_01945 [Pseudobutyrivibrio ruminis]|uniref:Transposase n=1 Tax=Pseudobutyrivibrio ruminis TaxID=46206 RepID=A0A927U5C4_9FIRM|nr:hypothetical protein [Pseudobutyrivibrio ruminis]
MDSTKVTRQVKMTTWANFIRQQQASGLNVTIWCEQNNISKTQFYYWKRKLKNEYLEQQLPDIVPVLLPDPIQPSVPAPVHHSECCTTCTTDVINTNFTMKISVQDITLEITQNTPDVLISKVIKAVRNA